MAKFCIHCGRKLEDGEVCTCQARRTQDNFGTNLLDCLKGIFTRPVDTIKTYANSNNFNMALVLMGIFCLTLFIFVISFVKNLYGGLADWGSFFRASNYYSMQVPYLEIFIVCVIISIIYAFGYTGILYLVNSVMFKGDKDYKKVFTMCAISSIMLSLGFLVGAILMFLNILLGIIIYLWCSLLSMLYTYKGLAVLGVSDENRHGYIYLVTSIFCTFVPILITFILNIFIR